jgi:hypothetical protein
MSYPAGPLFPGDPECAAPEGYNFTIWGTDDLPSEGLDFAFELQGQTIPEPASPILFGIGMLAMGLQRKVRGRRRVRWPALPIDQSRAAAELTGAVRTCPY